MCAVLSDKALVEYCTLRLTEGWIVAQGGHGFRSQTLLRSSLGATLASNEDSSHRISLPELRGGGEELSEVDTQRNAAFAELLADMGEISSNDVRNQLAHDERPGSTPLVYQDLVVARAQRSISVPLLPSENLPRMSRRLYKDSLPGSGLDTTTSATKLARVSDWLEKQDKGLQCISLSVPLGTVSMSKSSKQRGDNMTPKERHDRPNENPQVTLRGGDGNERVHYSLQRSILHGID
jgi:hypothetical protein